MYSIWHTNMKRHTNKYKYITTTTTQTTTNNTKEANKNAKRIESCKQKTKYQIEKKMTNGDGN